MLDAQLVYGPHDLALAEMGPVAAGRCLYRLLPEDRFDRQPLIDEGGRFLLVADIRIDNRGELLGELGIGPASGSAMSDAAILLAAWLRWGEDVLQRMHGDFAFALWDGEEQSLTLARDATGECPLHFHAGDGFFVFASMAPALASLPEIGNAVDEERLAQFVGDMPPRGPRSFYDKISRVEPGHCLKVTGQGYSSKRYWDPRGRELHLPRFDDYAGALTEQLDRAVNTRLRRASGRVGSQLSSGLDSNAVTSAAALALSLSGERLFAFTAAPRLGFADPVPAGRIADESSIAAEAAALHANIDHVVIRPQDESPLALLDTGPLLAGQPVGHVCNNLWWSGINEAARQSGVSVLLTGEIGNLTLSAGAGLVSLADLIRNGKYSRWWQESRALTRGEFGWINVLNASLGPWLPRRSYARLRAIAKGGADDKTSGTEFVGPQWKGRISEQLMEWDWDDQPERDSRDRRWALLQMADPGGFRKRSLAMWGIAERDATADRGLIEFCFSLPSDALLRDGIRQPALRRALAGRVARPVLETRLRGYQAADWYEHIDPEEVRAIAASGSEGVIDFEAIRAAVDSWPNGGWHERAILSRYRTRLLRALAAARFSASVRGRQM